MWEGGGGRAQEHLVDDFEGVLERGREGLRGAEHEGLALGFDMQHARLHHAGLAVHLECHLIEDKS